MVRLQTQRQANAGHGSKYTEIRIACGSPRYILPLAATGDTYAANRSTSKYVLTVAAQRYSTVRVALTAPFMITS